MIYLFIFLAKTIENTLCTFRLIVVSNGKKILGAILNAIISLIWILTTSLVIVKGTDYLRMIFFCLGCFLGSYLGSFFEEKIAFGNNMIICITKESKKNILIQTLLNNGFKTTYTRAGDKNDIQCILFIYVSRKKKKKVIDIIKKIDNKAIVLFENATKFEEKNISK